MKNSRIFILACGIICSLIMGFAYTYSIVQPYIMDYFSIASYMASLPYTIFLALFVVGNYVGGVMQKKHSVKMIMLIGYLLMAAGLFSTSLLPSSAPAGMWFTYGTLLGIGDGMVYNVIIAMMQKWFPDKKGLATGITLPSQGRQHLHGLHPGRRNCHCRHPRHTCASQTREGRTIIPGFRPVSRAGSFFAQKYDFFTQEILDNYPLYCVTL